MRIVGVNRMGNNRWSLPFKHNPFFNFKFKLRRNYRSGQISDVIEGIFSFWISVLLIMHLTYKWVIEHAYKSAWILWKIEPNQSGKLCVFSPKKKKEEMNVIDNRSVIQKKKNETDCGCSLRPINHFQLDEHWIFVPSVFH